MEHLQALRRLPPLRMATIGSVVVSAGLLLFAASAMFTRGPRASAATLAAANPPAQLAPETPRTVLEPVDPEPTGRFSPATAWRALYVRSHDLAGCRRSGVWGGTTATVTFGNDGAVSKVAFRPPFRGSATARCVADVLESAQVTPFAGRPGAVDFWFYVSPRQ
jgi:hypothetical protein